MRTHFHEQSQDNQEGILLIHPQDCSNQPKGASTYFKSAKQSKKRELDRFKKPDAGKIKKISKNVGQSQQRNKISIDKGSKKKQSLITKVYASSRPKQNNNTKQENKKNRPQHKSHNMNRYIDNKFNKFLMIGITLSFIIFVFIIMFVDLNKNSHPFSSFKIRLKKGINGSKSVFGFTVRQLGFDLYVQVGTQLDFLNLQMERQYRRFVKDYDKHFPYRVYSGNSSQPGNTSDINSINLNLRPKTNIMDLKNPPQQNTIENLQQINICIFTYLQYKSNQKLLNKIYTNYFTSIGQQNYTKYKIILIDDNSKDNISMKIYPFYSNNSVLLERITIIRNQKLLGKIGSFYLHKKQCLSSQVVIYINAYDSLNGQQVLKIISQTYKNPDIWMTYSKSYFQKDKKIDKQKLDVIQLNKQQKEKSTFLQPYPHRQISSGQQISGLVSHRVELLAKLPIEHFIQYQYNFNDLSLKPVFYNCTKNQFLIYILIQLCTSKHIKLIDHSLYLQDGSMLERDQCLDEKQSVCDMNARIKKEINALPSLSDNISLKNYQNPKPAQTAPKIIKQYVEKMQKLSFCKKQKIKNP